MQPLIEVAQLEDINKLSFEQPQIIFKHSTRCSISDLALGRINRATPLQNVTFYLLDLIKYRVLSNTVAEKYSVYHESPQILIIKNGECIFDESHNGISMQAIEEALV